MTNYLLSIDPSIKNTGFTLWEKRCHVIDCENNNCIELKLWMPIWIGSYSFKKYGVLNFESEIFFNNMKDTNIDLIIERGTFHSKNGIGYETQEHLRGFIAGQFNKLLTKNMLISPSEWKKWYVKNDKYCSAITFVNGINYKWDKNVSLFMCEYLIKENNWNIKISNHDEADSLLIGWYYLNKDNKWMKCLNCKNRAVGSAKIENYSRFNLYFCKTHFIKILQDNDIKIDDLDL